MLKENRVMGQTFLYLAAAEDGKEWRCGDGKAVGLSLPLSTRIGTDLRNKIAMRGNRNHIEFTLLTLTLSYLWFYIALPV